MNDYDSYLQVILRKRKKTKERERERERERDRERQRERKIERNNALLPSTCIFNLIFEIIYISN